MKKFKFLKNPEGRFFEILLAFLRLLGLVGKCVEGSFHSTEVLGVPSDAEFRDLSFEKGPRASGSNPRGKKLKKLRKM